MNINKTDDKLLGFISFFYSVLMHWTAEQQFGCHDFDYGHCSKDHTIVLQW